VRLSPRVCARCTRERGSFLSSRDTRSGGSAASGGQAAFREGLDSLLCIMADISVPLSSRGCCSAVVYLSGISERCRSRSYPHPSGEGEGVWLSARDRIDRSAFHRRRSFASLLVLLSCSRWTEDRDSCNRSVSLATRSRRWSFWLLDVATRSFAFRFRHSSNWRCDPIHFSATQFANSALPLVALPAASPGIALSVFKAFVKLSTRLSCTLVDSSSD